MTCLLHVVVGSVSYELVPVTAEVFNGTVFTFIFMLYVLIMNKTVVLVYGRAILSTLSYHIISIVQQMFRRISEALKKADATTLKALRDLITPSYTPNPSTVYMDNIYDMKSWICPYITTFQHHGTPHIFGFTKNGKGEVEMVYRLLAGGKCKEWLPKQGPFVVMKDIPPGYPSLLRPEDIKKCDARGHGKASDHLKSRLTGADFEWWTSFIAKKRV